MNNDLIMKLFIALLGLHLSKNLFVEDTVMSKCFHEKYSFFIHLLNLGTERVKVEWKNVVELFWKGIPTSFCFVSGMTVVL